jgi:hypothetical protein
MINTSTDMRFMSNNLLETGYNTMTVSSIADGYYQSDLTTHERARVMKFGGRFTIGATNNKIYINGSTYTLTSGEYLSGDLLAAHITTIIAASGVTCDHLGSTTKFRLSKASTFTANAATLTNAVWETLGIITGADVVATNTSGTYYVHADIPRYHYPNETIHVDFGYQADIGFVGIVGDLARELGIPEGAVVTFQANTVDDFTAPLVDKVLTWSERGLFAFIDDVDDTNFRYCKLIIEHPEGPTYPEIGYLYIGDFSYFIDRNISIGVTLGFVDSSIISNSDDGQEFVNEKTTYRTLSGMSVGLARPDNVDFLNRLFALKKRSAPFFVALDPRSQISNAIDDLTLFCKFSNPPTVKHIVNNLYELSFELKESL